jgi:undecaprenyl-phosphate galactose phosphotransferase
MNIILSGSLHATAIIRSLIYGIITLILFTFLFKYPFISGSRVYIILFSIISFLILISIRVILIPATLGFFTKHKKIYKNVVIVGTGKTAKLLATRLGFENIYGIKIFGFIDDHKKIGEEVIDGIKVIGTIQQLQAINDNHEIHEVVIAIDEISYENLLNIIDISNELKVFVKITSDLFNIIPRKLVTEKYSGIPIINVSPKVNDNLNIIFKRVFDVTASSLGLIVLSPMLIIIASLIKLTSKGPVLYSQTRIGKDGKPFPFYKFRSMTVTNENDAERQKMMLEFMKADSHKKGTDTKVINNKRVTKIGKFIRKTSLDELPQLFNVIKGDMSLVGPRPCLPYEYNNYEEWQKRRHEIIPGCTGVWQVSGRGNVSFNDSVILDLYYIKNMSPWLDLQIILKTIPVMIFARGGK